MIDLPISVVLLVSIFLLCCTGAAEKPCRALRVSAGSVAALSLVLAALSAFELPLLPHVNLQPAAALAVLCGALLNAGERGRARVFLGAAVCSVAAWALRRAFPEFPEPGALLALPAALVGRFFIRNRRGGLLCVLLTPLVYGLIVTFEDWYLFDFVAFAIGGALQLDMQICGAALYALLLLPSQKAVRRERVQTARTELQKES